MYGKMSLTGIGALIGEMVKRIIGDADDRKRPIVREYMIISVEDLLAELKDQSEKEK